VTDTTGSKLATFYREGIKIGPNRAILNFTRNARIFVDGINRVMDSA
jgi:hypothetical protein